MQQEEPPKSTPDFRIYREPCPKIRAQQEREYALYRKSLPQLMVGMNKSWRSPKGLNPLGEKDCLG